MVLGFKKGTHSIPLLEYRNSRRHYQASLARLAIEAKVNRALAYRRLRHIETFVQFAGFPRSGHSLIGSIIDAHSQARISHELDAVGLWQQGFSLADIYALIDSKARQFTKHGRYWNGFRYAVSGGSHSVAIPLKVVGDKKGDWAVRRASRDPDLLGRLQTADQVKKKWILVLRNPYDNIATMSLRKGRYYDELRMRNPGEQFLPALRHAQHEGRITDRVLHSEIEEYEQLCRTVAQMKDATPAQDWFELSHEDIAATPGETIQSLMAFLNLPADDRYIDGAASMVKRNVNESRRQLAWSPERLAQIDGLIRSTPFLRRYAEN